MDDCNWKVVMHLLICKVHAYWEQEGEKNNQEGATSLVIKKYYKSLFSLCKKSAGTDVLADYFSNLLDLS